MRRFRHFAHTRDTISIMQRRTRSRDEGRQGGDGSGGREGERISLTFISGARWRNGGETRLARHVGGNWLRKHCAAYYYVIRPAWLLCYHFSWSSGESANEINLITSRLSARRIGTANIAEGKRKSQINEPALVDSSRASIRATHEYR